MVAFADDPEIRHRIAFLPGYDIGMARYLYWGCDVWLNNPLRPLEACGTSGMKAALNGGLNLSIRDGWWDEWFDGQNGWAIPTADGVADPDRRDEVEARAIYDLLEQPGAAAVLRARPRRRPGPLGRDGAAHAARDRPQGAGHPHGARLRAGAVRAGRRLGPGDGRRRLRPGARGGGLAGAPAAELARPCGWRTSRRPAAATPRRSGRRWTLRAEVELPGPDAGATSQVAGGLRPGGRRRRAAPGDHGADGARAHRRLAALVHRHRCRWSGPAPSATPCACSRTPSTWPTRRSSGW